jgi:predicted oxidoreductase (fatty acid repression mutant protein)
MMKDHDLPTDRCSEYEIEANAMTQFAIWTGLSYLGCGVNIQHFRPEADKDIAKTFSIPSSWVLRTQMVFGETAFVPTEHEHLDIKTRIMINR